MRLDAYAFMQICEWIYALVYTFRVVIRCFEHSFRC